MYIYFLFVMSSSVYSLLSSSCRALCNLCCLRLINKVTVEQTGKKHLFFLSQTLWVRLLHGTEIPPPTSSIVRSVERPPPLSSGSSPACYQYYYASSLPDIPRSCRKWMQHLNSINRALVPLNQIHHRGDRHLFNLSVRKQTRRQ